MCYVIFKASRAPDHTYDGPSWDKAGIRHLRQEFYESREKAESLAQMLTEVNPVGFKVGEYDPA